MQSDGVFSLVLDMPESARLVSQLIAAFVVLQEGLDAGSLERARQRARQATGSLLSQGMANLDAKPPAASAERPSQQVPGASCLCILTVSLHQPGRLGMS